MKRLQALVVCTTALAWAPGALAQEKLPFKPTATEMAALPDFCKARLGGTKDQQKPWAARMGKQNYMHLHHYCYGLAHIRRAQDPMSGKHRRHYTNTALAQFNYVLRNWPDDFYLKAEAQNHKARLDMQMKLR